MTKNEGEEKMRRKTEDKYDVENEALEKYLDVIGASIIEFNKQMEEVD